MNVIGSNAKHTTACAVTHGPRHHFFGYYDKCPWDNTSRYILALETEFMTRPPGPLDKATIGLIDLEKNKWETLAHTRAWNWQQGCMLQWLGKDRDRLIVYNDRQDDQFVGIVQNIYTGAKHILPRPVYAVSNDGKLALSLNFTRLHKMNSGYGYATQQKTSKFDPKPDNDGIYLMDLKSGESRLIVSIADIADIKKKPSMESAIHWFNHLMFSSDHNRFVFLHRWTSNYNERRPISLLDFPSVSLRINQSYIFKSYIFNMLRWHFVPPNFRNTIYHNIVDI